MLWKITRNPNKMFFEQIEISDFLLLVTQYVIWCNKNNQKITVNNYKLDDIKTIGHHDLNSKTKYNISESLKILRTRTNIVDIGSITRASMCVGTGDFTFAVFTGTEHKNCDIAAVKVIVEEAGGKVTDFFGNEQRYDKSINGAVISNGKVHNEVLGVIKKYIIEE